MHATDTHPTFDTALNAIDTRMRTAHGGLDEVFTPFPVVIGARWMETPIRHGLAQRVGVAANLAFLLVDDAVDRLVASADVARWWEEGTGRPNWSVAAVRGRVVQALRTSNDPEVAALAASLNVSAAGPLAWRALAFADTFATAVLDWMRVRPDAPVGGSKDSEPRWFAPLVTTLGIDEDTSPRHLRRQALAQPAAKAPPGPWGGPMVVGTTRLPGATRRLLELFDAQFLPVVPAASAASAGLASRLRVRACYGPLREVEALRDWLLELLAQGAGSHGITGLTPRDVLVLTPSPEVYGPLVEAVFARTGVAVAGPAAATTVPAPEGSGAAPDDASDEDGVEDDGGDEMEEALEEDGAPIPTLADASTPTRRRTPPTLPVRIVELGLCRANPLAETLVLLLGLAEDRVELPALLAVLALRPVQRRFAIPPEELPALTEMLVASGARWAFDAADRAQAGQPELAQNTLRFGLERMALGRLLPGDTLDDAPGREPRVAMDLGSREQLARMGRLDRLLRDLRAAVSGLRATERDGLTPSGWRTRFNTLLEGFTEIPAAGAWQRRRLEDVLDELLPRDDASGLLAPSAVRRLLIDGFALPQSVSPPNEGAITLAPLRPHGVLPARVVALVGMGLGAHPNAPLLPAWHPLARTEPADDPRAIAAAAFNAACAAATDRLWISWPAFEMQRGRELPTCAAVSALLDDTGLAPALEAAMKQTLQKGAVVERDAAVARVHRHPWDAATASILDPDHAQVHLVDPSVRPAGANDTPQVPDPYLEPLPDPDCPTALTVDDLVRALLNPSQVFLRDRLGIYLPEDDAPPPTREPLDVDTLGRYDVRVRLLEAHRAAQAAHPADVVLTRLRGEGKLPIAAGAASLVGTQDRVVSALLDTWTTGAPAGDPGPVDISSTVAGVVLSTRVARSTRSAGDWTVETLGVSSPTSPKARLRAWVTALLAAAHGDGQAVTAIAYGLASNKPLSYTVNNVTPLDAATELPKLVAVWRKARTTPIDLFEETSGAIAAAEAETEAGTVARTAELRTAAHGFHAKEDDTSRPDGTNRHVRALHPSYDAVGAVAEPDAAIIGLARDVWGALAEREHDVKAAKPAKPAKKTRGAQ